MATSQTKSDVLESLESSHPQWPHSSGRDTVNGDPWPLAWDAAAFIEEWFDHPEHNNVEEAICYTDLDPAKFGYDITDWSDKKPPEPLLRSHLLRIVKGWDGETDLHNYLENNSELVDELGFEKGLPSLSTFWRVWNDYRLTPDHKEVIRTIGQVLVNVAREHDIPAPDEVFHPDPSVDTPDDVEQDDNTVRNRTIAKSRDMWERSKPIITENYGIPRGDNTEIHENAFLEAQTFMGAREGMCAEDGTWNFAADTGRDRVQSGSTHRHHIQKISPPQARKMHRETTKELIEHAQRESKLTDPVTAAIDISKSNPYRTKKKLEFNDNGEALNEWLLGYKYDNNEEAEYYFQWASIQIVGLDTPLVLDAIPVNRGLPRADIVDQLLDFATELVDIELVLMDRAFENEAVKDTCEDHDVYYLNPGKMRASEKATCTRLRREEKLVDIQHANPSDADSNKSSRKEVYVPAINTEWTGDEVDDDEEHNEEGQSGSEKTNTGKQGFLENLSLTEARDDEENPKRKELLTEFTELTDVDFEEDDSLANVLEDIREEEANEKTRGSEEDAKLYALFETNHPDIVVPDDGEMSQTEKIHMVSRVVRMYGDRWGIENGFKQIKTFRVRTTSMNHEYRFFNFLFACTLYNLWRLTDILVKLELGVEHKYRQKPLVTADLFLTIAKDNDIGLDPPD